MLRLAANRITIVLSYLLARYSHSLYSSLRNLIRTLLSTSDSDDPVAWLDKEIHEGWTSSGLDFLVPSTSCWCKIRN